MGGKITLSDKKDKNKKYEANFLPGFYTIESFAETFKNAFSRYEIKMISDFYRPTGVLYLENPNSTKYNINFSKELAKLLNIGNSSSWIVYIKKLNSSTTYFIHCDLIDKEANLFNGKPSSILADFDIKGEAFERVF